MLKHLGWLSVNLIITLSVLGVTPIDWGAAFTSFLPLISAVGIGALAFANVVNRALERKEASDKEILASNISLKTALEDITLRNDKLGLKMQELLDSLDKIKAPLETSDPETFDKIEEAQEEAEK